MPEPTAFQANLADEMLKHFPQRLRIDALKDRSFREISGLGLTTTLTLGNQAMSISGAVLFDSARRLYAGEPSVTVVITGGSEATLSIAFDDGEPRLEAVMGERTFNIPPLYVLSPDKELRLRMFESQLEDAYVANEVRDRWQVKLAEKALSNEEVYQFDRDMECSAQYTARLIAVELKKPEADVRCLVPRRKEYYWALAGSTAPPTFESYLATEARKHADALLKWHSHRGLAQLLLVCPHPRLASGVSISGLAADEVTNFFEWVDQDGDRFSQVAAFEIGVRALADFPAVEPILLRIANRIKDDDTSDTSGRLALTAGLIAFVDGEISRCGALRTAPPYYRRLASIASASILERELVAAGVSLENAGDWASHGRYQQFYAQSLTDLRLEPRWIPDLISAGQLRQEFLCRLHIASCEAKDSLPEGELRSFVLGTGENALEALLNIPAAYLPGPLEGGVPSVHKVPTEMLAQLYDPIDEKVLDATFFVGIINASLIYNLEREAALQIVKIVRHVNYRLTVDSDCKLSVGLLMGLAIISASTRVTELADEIRILTRIMRRRGDLDTQSDSSLRIALTACAAYSDEAQWSRAVGEWMLELAYEPITPKIAKALRSYVQKLCLAAPYLLPHISRADAALAAVIGYPVE